MSDKYKEIIALQRANNEVRAKVNAWIQSNVNEDAESLQSIVMDTEGELVPAPDGGWDEDNDVFNEQLDAAKEKVYVRILNFLQSNPVERAESVEVSDPNEPIVDEPKPEPKPKAKAKPKTPDAVASAIATLLNASTSSPQITEARVREIVREELTKMLDQLYVGILDE